MGCGAQGNEIDQSFVGGAGGGAPAGAGAAAAAAASEAGAAALPLPVYRTRDLAGVVALVTGASSGTCSCIIHRARCRVRSGRAGRGETRRTRSAPPEHKNLVLDLRNAQTQGRMHNIIYADKKSELRGGSFFLNN